MKILVRGHHVSITKPLKDYAEKKAQKVFKFFENIQDVVIELNYVEGVEEKRQVASATVHAAGKIIRAQEASKDLYASIDILIEKVQKQLKKHKEKLKSRTEARTKRRVPADKGQVAVAPAAKVSVVKAKKSDKLTTTEALTPQEAASVLSETEAPFLVFNNSKTDSLCVIYAKGEPGQFGLVDTATV
ncbi:MAG: ribosome-associated translation inhibitor RaiA [Candidatus Margulisiibacteriota bacterium]